MDWNTVKGNWKHFTGSVRERWGDLTDDEVQQIKGERDQLVGAVQKKYGESKDAAEKQVDEWMNSDSVKKLMANFDDAKDAINKKMADLTSDASSKS